MPQAIRSLSDLLNRLPRYTISLIGFAVILTLCWLPASTVKEPKWFNIPNADKAIHFALFCIWAFCLQRDAYRNSKSTAYQIALWVFLAGLFTAVLTESLQPIVSNRMRDLSDALADTAGTLTGIILFPILFKKKNEK